MSKRTCSIEGCSRPHSARGWCQAHYMRWHRSGDPYGSGPPVGHSGSEPIPPEARFEQKVDKRDPDDCWPWTGRIHHSGYGRIRWEKDGEERELAAHRYSYERFVQPIPDGLVLDHICHNLSDCEGGSDCPHRACVNPRHLQAVTLAENCRRGNTGLKRHTGTHCRYGHLFDEENTYWRDGKYRVCRTCRDRRVREWRERQRA